MADRLLACDRDQAFLFPPGVCDWLPTIHLAGFVVVAVVQLPPDLGREVRLARSAIGAIRQKSKLAR